MFERLGLHHTPWVIRIYLALLLLLTLLVLLANPPSTNLWSLASEGFKTVLAALLGALSVAGENHLRGSS